MQPQPPASHIGSLLAALFSGLVAVQVDAAPEDTRMTQPTESASPQPVADPHAPDSPERAALVQTFWDASEALSERFEAHTHTRGERVMPYRLFIPAVEPGKTYPLVIFLHGAGGRGDDNVKQYTGGNRFGTHIWAMPQNQAKYPCFILAPQTEAAWYAHDGHGGRMAPNPEEPGTGLTAVAATVIEIIDQLTADYPIDRDRLILTGQSMGGGGTWYLLSRRPHMFAAAVPVCGVWTERTLAAEIAHVPVWVFHGNQDQSVPVARSRGMVQALQAAGGSVAYTEYPGVGHASWNFAYTEPVLVPWAMSQRRQSPE